MGFHALRSTLWASATLAIFFVGGVAHASPAGDAASAATAGDVEAVADQPSTSDIRDLRDRAQRKRGRDLLPGNEQADTQRPPPGLAGDWFGVKDKLEDIGIVPTARYTSEAAWNFSGGSRRDATETGQFDIGLNIDLQKLAGISGTFQATVTYRRGHDLGQRAGLGVLQQVQEVYGRGQTWRLTQFWYEHALFGDKVEVKVGRTAPGEDFAAFSCTFENLSFCGAQPGNLVGDYWYNWPISQWGGRARLNLGRVYIQAAVYEANPRNLDVSFFNWHFSGATGALVPAEIGVVTGGRAGGTVGSYKVGGWINTSDSRALPTASVVAGRLAIDDQTQLRSSRYGAYVSFQQQLSGRSDGGKAVSGLTVFLNATQADKETSRIDRQIAIGAFYRGLLPWFTEDVLGVGLAQTHVNARVADVDQAAGQPRPRSEYEAELFYGFHPFTWVELRPNLQWIHNPGGIASKKDIGVLGLKAALTL